VKILHVLRDLSRNGGAQRIVFDLISTNQFDTKISVLVTSIEDGPDYIEQLRSQGIEVLIVSKWSLYKLWKIFNGFDVVHAHLFPALYLVGLLARNKVYTEHNTENNRRSIFFSNYIESFIYKRYDKVTCITPAVQDALTKFLSLGSQNNTVVIYNGIDTQSFSCKPKIYKNVKEYLNIGMVGRLVEYKDQDTIIRAMPFLGNNVYLHLVGDGERKSKLVLLAKELGVEKRVIFHGVLNDIPKFLQKLDIYIQSSKVDGFGLAPIEAMAANLPTLCSNIPGLSDLFDKKINLFNQGDYTDLKDKILSIINDQKFNEELLELGEKTVFKYSILSTHKEFMNIYKKII